MKPNPYHKYLGPEDHLQHAVMNYLRIQYPEVMAIHVPNEGKRSPFVQYKFKYLGGMAGIPDVIVFKGNEKYQGLAIELKVKPNKPTKAQREFITKLNDSGWYATWCDNYEGAVRIIRQYFADDL